MSWKTPEMKCPKCGHRFTVRDLDPCRPALYCRKCDDGFLHPVLYRLYQNAIAYGISEGKKEIRREIKNALAIGEL